MQILLLTESAFLKNLNIVEHKQSDLNCLFYCDDFVSRTSGWLKATFSLFLTNNILFALKIIDSLLVYYWYANIYAICTLRPTEPGL